MLRHASPVVLRRARLAPFHSALDRLHNLANHGKVTRVALAVVDQARVSVQPPIDTKEWRLEDVVTNKETVRRRYLRWQEEEGGCSARLARLCFELDSQTRSAAVWGL